MVKALKHMSDTPKLSISVCTFLVLAEIENEMYYLSCSALHGMIRQLAFKVHSWCYLVLPLEIYKKMNTHLFFEEEIRGRQNTFAPERFNILNLRKL